MWQNFLGEMKIFFIRDLTTHTYSAVTLWERGGGFLYLGQKKKSVCTHMINAEKCIRNLVRIFFSKPSIYTFSTTWLLQQWNMYIHNVWECMRRKVITQWKLRLVIVLLILKYEDKTYCNVQQKTHTIHCFGTCNFYLMIPHSDQFWDITNKNYMVSIYGYQIIVWIIF